MTRPLKRTVEVCFSPKLYEFKLTREDFIVVIVDILRATTSICAAFDHGVEKIIPVGGVENARKYKDKLKKEDSHRRELIENRHNLSEILTNKKLTFSLQSWENGKVYWGIWEKDIITEIKKKFKIDLTKKHIEMPDGHIKKLWETYVYIKFWKDAMAKITVEVTANQK